MYSTQEPLRVNLCCMGICLVSECVFDVTGTCGNVSQVCVRMLNRNEDRWEGGGVFKPACL